MHRGEQRLAGHVRDGLLVVANHDAAELLGLLFERLFGIEVVRSDQLQQRQESLVLAPVRRAGEQHQGLYLASFLQALHKLVGQRAMALFVDVHVMGFVDEH